MEDQIVPQKRSAEPEPPTHHYSTRSTTNPKNNKNIVVEPRLKPIPFKLADLLTELKVPAKVATESLELKHQTTGEIRKIDFFSSDDHPFNRRGFKYKPCRPNPELISNLYSTTDLPPYSVRLSYFDKSSGISTSDDHLALTTSQGWRSARTNIGIREGKYYMEFNILNSNENSHVRIGLARKEASIEAPVGFDGYGYGLRDKTGQKIHLSRPAQFMKSGFATGDIIGFYVELPSLKLQQDISDKQYKQNTKSQPVEKDDNSNKKSAFSNGNSKTDRPQIPNNIVRDQIPIKYKSNLYFEQFEYTSTKEMDHLLNPVTVFGEKAIPDQNKFKPATLPDSKIVVYKNGELVGTAFENLYCFLPPNSEQSGNVYKNQDDGSLGYYPMLSVFKKGSVELNAGPEFQRLPDELKQGITNGDIKCLSDRYDETVVEDLLWDMIDEVEAQYLDSYED